MSFHDLEIQNIKNTVGNLCERITNPSMKDKLRFDYDIQNHNVIIQEIRPYWQDAAKTIYHDIAKLKFVRTKNEWSLYWMRASGKWERYPPSENETKLKELVKVIEQDEHCCFFG